MRGDIVAETMNNEILRKDSSGINISFFIVHEVLNIERIDKDRQGRETI